MAENDMTVDKTQMVTVECPEGCGYRVSGVHDEVTRSDAERRMAGHLDEHASADSIDDLEPATED